MPFGEAMSRFNHIPPSAAMRHIVRVASLLKRAETHLSAASSLASDRYQREQFHRLNRDLRSIGSVVRSASTLESEGL